MSEQTPDGAVPAADLDRAAQRARDEADAPAVGDGTDIDADDLDVTEGAAGADTPATSDPDAFVDDATLGGTGGQSSGGAG
jgi:hypothetical protein